jgi:hypothetical protein
MQEKTEMRHKVGKDPEGGSKERKEVGNESPLSCMFQKQQTYTNHESRILQYLKRKIVGVRRGSVDRTCTPVRKGHT